MVVYLACQTSDGATWVSVVTRPPLPSALVECLGPHLVRVTGDLPPGDPALSMLTQPWALLGFSVVQEYSRDRVRLNGRLSSSSLFPSSSPPSSAAPVPLPAGPVRVTFELELTLVMGLCPKYIVDRRVINRRKSHHPHTIESRSLFPVSSSSSSQSSLPVPEAALALLRRTDTFWLGTTEPQWGAQTSHRGGLPGFIRLSPSTPTASSPLRVLWGDYRGNRFFHSLGSALSNPQVGLAVLDYTTGDLLQLTGQLRIIGGEGWEGPDLDGTNRHCELTVAEWRWTTDASPFVYRQVSASIHNPPLTDPADPAHPASPPTPGHRGRPLRLAAVTRAAEGVKTFHFRSVSGDGHPTLQWIPGQYATLQVEVAAGQWVERSWTITSLSSASDDCQTLDITVKRAGQGFVSRFLHDQAGVGMTVRLMGVEGSFSPPSLYWPELAGGEGGVVRGRPLRRLWLSAGIGCTPFVAHLRAVMRFHQLHAAAGVAVPPTDVVWVHVEQTVGQVVGWGVMREAMELGRQLPGVFQLRVLLALTRAAGEGGKVGDEVVREVEQRWGEKVTGGEEGRVAVVAGRPSADTLVSTGWEVSGRGMDACGSTAVMEEFRRWAEEWKGRGWTLKGLRTESFSY